jgi:outer membrane protein assembly factor BamC
MIRPIQKSPSLPISLLILAVGSALLAGCGSYSLERRGPDYRSSSGQAAKSLEIPPDLTSPGAEDRFVIPTNRGSTTFSSYNRERSAQPIARDAGVLPKVDKASVVRAGDQRWLVVAVPPDKLWPVVKEFWGENGFILKREQPEVGIMETDWAENRAKLPLDPVRRTIGRVFDGIYTTSERDKFRTRLEAGAAPGTTEVFISHRGVAEIFTSEYKDQTIWQPRPADRELEADFLNRLLVKLGFDERTATQTVASATPASAEAAASFNPAGAGSLQVKEPFDRAWRRVGLALDRVGFTVEDRDRAKGLYFVRYIDPEADNKGPQKSFLARLAFWRKDVADDQKPQYRVYVADAGGVSTVTVQNAKGEPETSPTGKRILNLLLDQLK